MNSDKGKYDWRKQLVELGTLIRKDGTMRCPKPNMELQRREFAKRNSDCIIVSIYNNGKNLFFDGGFNSPITYYMNPWKWILYKDFCNPRCVTVGNDPTRSMSVFIRTLGHNYRCAYITVGTQKATEMTVRFRNFQIPEKSILFVAVRKTGIPKSLIVFQPLPAELVKPDYNNLLVYDF